MNTLAETFDQQSIPDSNGCWVWQRGRKGKEAKAGGGYGCLKVGGRTVGAHVLAWERANGRKVPAGLHVMHECHNTLCVRPSHLSLGTNDENAAAKAAALRAPHKLTVEIVRKIRTDAVEGKTQRVIAKEHGLHQADISNIVNRKYWRHVA